MEKRHESSDTMVSPVAVLGFIMALVAGVTEMLAGMGTRWGLWDYRSGFVILRWAAYGGMAAAVVSLIAGVVSRPGNRRRGFALAFCGFLIASAVAGMPLTYWLKTKYVPAIHDITTDMQHPPHFVALLPLRKSASNSAEYGGPAVAAKQRAAYPDIAPLELSRPPDQAFSLALEAARAMGWKIVAANEREGRIEATDTTFWFGFSDDIVMRVAAADGRSRIDIRSLSRVGKSDLGTNARRIRAYLKKLHEMG